MTGQEFVNALQREIMDNGKSNARYSMTDLMHDAGAVGLWGEPLSVKSQGADLSAAREEVKKLDQGEKPNE